MKLFSEYYAGHINHDFHLFGEDDIKFLHQFPKAFWQKAFAQRYCADLPKALLARDEARRKPLPGLKNSKGKTVKQNYYQLIDELSEGIYNNLPYQGRNNLEIEKIRNSSHDNAKNIIDSRIVEVDGGGAWMKTNYTKRKYIFKKKHKGKEIEYPPITIQNNYITELVNRIEGPKGSSPVGFDLSNLKNFNPEIEDDDQKGSWYTDGFTCPEMERIIDNMLSWIGFSSQALLSEPGSIIDQESHRISPKQRYNIGTEARELIDETIYKKPLQNKYQIYINQLKKEFSENGTIDPNHLNYLRTKFNSLNEDGGYSYRRALRGMFPERLRAIVGTEHAERLNNNQLTRIIAILADVHNPFERHLVNALADIDLITHRPKTYYNFIFDVYGNANLMHRTTPHPNVEGEEIPELHNGKILINIEDAKSSIMKALEEAERNDDEEEANRLRIALQNLDTNRRVGHHFSPLDLELSARKRKRRPIFYQFVNERDMPKGISRQSKIAAGGIQPNKGFVEDKGPGTSDLAASMNHLNQFINNNTLFDSFLQDFISDNYNGKYNILFKTFINPAQAIISPSTYNVFKKLIKDRAFRNLNVFNLSLSEANRYISTMNRKMKLITKQICDVLIQKEIGASSTIRRRIREISDAASAEARMHEMIGKAMR
jgi:hypothetical protein